VRSSRAYAGAVLSALIAGCSNQSGAFTPLGSAVGALTSSASPAISRVPSSCRIARYYRFEGSCTSAPLAPRGSTYRLATYRGIRASFKIPPNGSHGYAFTFADATGQGDIGRFRGKAFPLYPNPCGDSSCPGTAFLYVGARLTGPGVLMTSGPNVFSYHTGAGYPGTTCGEAELLRGKWYAFGQSASPKGEKLTFSSAIDYKVGAFTIAVYCE
jgi:hypothetical protein